jgi:hypothetical protein
MITSVRSFCFILLSLLASLGLSLAAAQERPTVHEFVPNVEELEVAAAILGSATDEGSFIYRGEVIRAPRGGAISESEAVARPVVSSGRRLESPVTAFSADRVTSFGDEVDYQHVFSPRVAPFKRLFAYDEVQIGPDGRNPILVVGDRRLRPVAMSRPEASVDSAERFWGSLVADFRNARTVRLPSVGPTSRVLQIRTEPEVALRLERDAADNFFATLLDQEAARVRISWLVEEPWDYFNTSLEGAIPLGVPTLPNRIRRRADDIMRRIGIPRRGDAAETLRALTGYFRAFEESDEAPRDTGDLLRDLTFGQRGICRHRAYAFTILAQAAGIPTRLLHNEAHAWVEVELREGQWLRIDLGGAAAGLRSRQSPRGPTYVPRARDPFPRPEAYLQTLREGAARAQERRDTEARAESSDGVTSQPSPSVDASADVSMQGGGLRVRLNAREFRVYRGRPIAVSGRVTNQAGRGASGARLQIALRGPSSDVPLGVTVSGPDGYFDARFGVPQGISVGPYQLLVNAEDWNER